MAPVMAARSRFTARQFSSSESNLTEKRAAFLSGGKRTAGEDGAQSQQSSKLLTIL
jgi:hypothetical protein